MEYVLLIYAPENETPPTPADKLLPAYAAFGEEAAKAGVMVGGNRLRPPAAAVSVRVRDGKTTVTDGPFAETREQLGGYYILDCKTPDEAIAYAAKIPGALHGTIEVRPIWSM